MANMNHLTLAAEQAVHTTDINPDDVLRAYGLDDAVQISTVAQNGGTIVTIPEGANTAGQSVGSSLTPPPIADDNNIDNMLDDLANEMLGVTTAVPDETEAPNEAIAADSGNPPVDLDAEEDEDWEELEDAGIITQIGEADIVTAVTIIGTPSDSAPNEITALDTQEAVANAAAARAETATLQRLSAEEAINLLPVNSLSYATDETTSRFSGAAWYNAVQQSSLVLAGLGGIGGYVLFCLSRMKPKQIFLYDDDVVEMANLSGQLYSSTMVGLHKVDAMAELARTFSLYYGVQAVPQKFTPETPAADIMICGFDNMQARKDFFNAWVNHLVNHPHPEKCLFIDGRLNMEEFQVFCMKGNDTFNIKKYNTEYLFEDYQAESIACSQKQTTYCANMIGSVIVNLFTNFIANQLKPLIDRDLPFKTYYDASMMYFKTEV